MESVLDNLSPESLALAIETNRSEFILSSGVWDRATVFDEPEMAMVVTDVPIPLPNVVTRVRLSPDNLDANIEKAINRFKEKGVPGNWHVGPATRPTDIGNVLVSRGFIQTESGPGMAIDLFTLSDASLPPGFVIEPMRSVDQLDGYGEVMLRGFEIPDFLRGTFLDFINKTEIESISSTQSYIGMLKGKPVGVSTVFFGAGVAGIYRVATVPEARGKGVGTAMTVRPLIDARAKGYRVGILQSSEMGYSVYEKIGFREYCKLNIFTWQPG